VSGSVYIWFMDGTTFIQDQPIKAVEDPNWDLGG